MARPYSMDLRERVIEAILGGLSRRQAAAQFKVSISVAIGWMERYQETGSVQPGQMGGHKPRKISGDHEAWLQARCRAGDFTIHGLVRELKDRRLDVDYRSVWDFIHREGYSFKKRQWSRASEAGRMSPVDVING